MASNKKEDIVSLAKEAAEAGLLPQHVVEVFISLPFQVPSSLKHRYLLTHLQQSTRDNNELMNRMRRALQPLSEEKSNSSMSSAPLSADQLFDLCEVLVEYAHKWEELGFALRFKPQDLKNIRAIPHLQHSAPQSFLRQLVEEWLEHKHEHTEPPTLENLENALKSRMVGLAKVAEQLKTSIHIPKPLMECSPPFCTKSISFPQSFEERIAKAAHKTVLVQENSPVLFEIRTTSSTENASFTYQWFRGKKKIQNTKQYFGATGPILSITKADTDTDGTEFSCRVTVREENHSTIIRMFKLAVFKVSCSLDSYTDSLASTYLSQPEVPKNNWPPVSSKKYINLVLLKNVNDWLQEDTQRSRKDFQICDILKGMRSRKVIFVKGRPGCGKTTFVHKITRDWATTSRSGRWRLVLLISLRVLNTLNKPKLDLSDILELFSDLKVSRQLIEERRGKGVCFIFDGFDEFSPHDGISSVVHKIIRKEYLNQCTVFIASRPAALVSLGERPDNVIKVLGFETKQTLEYFNFYPFSDASRKAKVKDYLLSHPNILHMCSLPIHAAMVGFLFEVTRELPQTETEIYTHFTNLTLKNALNKTPDDMSSEEKMTFDQICKLALHKTILNKQVLHQDEVDFIHKKYQDISLGLITIDRITELYDFKNIYTFLHLTFQEYLAAYHISTLSDEEQSKLIQEHRDKIHMKEVWKFYCGLVGDASIRLREILNTTELEIIDSIQCAYESQQPSTCNVVLDYTNSELEFHFHQFTSIPELSALAYVMSTASTPFSLSLNYCDMSNKAIDAILSRHVGYQMLQDLKYHSDCLNRTEVEYLKQCLLHFKSIQSLTLSAIYMSNSCSLDDKHPIQISTTSITNLNIYKIPVGPKTLKTIICNNKGIQSLTLCGSIGSAEVQVLEEHLRHCKELRELNITENDLVDSHAELLAKSLEICTSLKTINIAFNNFSNRGVLALLQSLQHCSLLVHSSDVGTSNAVLIDGLKDCTSLQELHFKYRDSVGSTNFVSYSRNWKKLHTLEFTRCLHSNAIGNGLKQLHSLQILKISENDFSDEGAEELAEAISYCTNLKVLEFSWNENVTDRGVAALAISLKKLKNLQEFNCSNMKPSIAEIANSLKELTNLRVLNLSQSKFRDEEAEVLTSGIKALHCLERLRLGGNEITAVGASPLIQSLRQCPNLTILDLCKNRIGTDGSSIISASLKYWPNLQELNLSGDLDSGGTIFENIGRQGVLVLVENLHNCSQLTKLNLSFNAIGDQVAIKVAQQLRDHCPNVTYLYLRYNNITTEGGETIASCTKFWKKFVNLFYE